MSDLFKLNLTDLAKGAVSALIAGFVFALGGLFQSPDFNVFGADWGSILNTAVNAGFAALVGYLGKNLLTSKDGAILGFGGGKKE